MAKQKPYSFPVPWVPVKNVHEDSAPPFALLEVTGVTDDGFFLVTRPTDDSSPCLLLNGASAIPSGDYGSAHASNQGVAAYRESEGTPAVGQTWGSKAGRWELHPDQDGFRIFGGATYGMVNVLRQALTDDDGEGSGSGSGGGLCIDEIGNVPLTSLPGYDPAYSTHILGISADGCLIAIPTGTCQLNGSGS